MTKFAFIFLLLLGTTLQAQDTDSKPSNEFNLGLGIGLDYGGFGVRGTYVPVQHLGLFASAGYNLNAVGFNAGAQWLFPKNRRVFYLTAMYGYNAVLIVKGDITDKGTYYGVTAGAGYQWKTGSRGNFWNFELLVPFRTANFYDDYDAVEMMGIKLSRPLPIAFCFGYHFKI